MKRVVFLLIIYSNILLLSNCSIQTNATQSNNLAVNANRQSNTKVSETPRPQTENEKRAEELDKQNERFRQIPNDWQKVDFKNFKYPFGRLKNGRAEIIEKQSNGVMEYNLRDVFYIELTGDKSKEAIVIMGELSCGGSCSGGGRIPYFYSIHNGRAKLIGIIKAGHRSTGCLIKSLRLENKKIFLEQFGKCKKNSSSYWDEGPSCKFCVSGLTKSVYSFKNLQLLRESIEEKDSESINLMNYSEEISIKE